jgi:N-acetylneuraminic acid mutarotase
MSLTAWIGRIAKLKSHRCDVNCRRSGARWRAAFKPRLEALEERVVLDSTGGTWFTLAAMPSSRQELATAVLNGEIYAIAGYDTSGMSTNTVEVYNPTTDAWRSAASLPIANNHEAAAVAAGTLYTFGGESNRTFAYDPNQDAWSEVASMHYMHGNTPAVAVIGEHIYVAGGTGPGMQQNEVEVYDPSANTWTILAAMNVPRNHTSGGAIGGKFYVAGGRDSPQAAAALEVYDPQTNLWTRLTDLPTPRSGLAAGVVNGSLYTFGGEQPRLFSEVEAYNPADNTWRQLTPMPTPRHGIFAAVIDNSIYLPGGATQQGYGASNVNELFKVGPVLAPIADQTIPASQNPLTVTLSATHPDGLPLTFLSPQAESLAYVLKQQLGLYTDGNLRENWGGRGEKWLLGNGALWYFITPGGNLYRWDGTEGSATGTFVGTPGSSCHADPSLLYDAQPGQAHALLSISGNVLTITRDAGFVGSLFITVSVTDGSLTDSKAFTVTVQADAWTEGASLPLSLGEVAGGVVGHILYLVGEGNSATLAYDVATGLWTSASLATRPFVGNHHAAEVINGKLYLFGGLSGGSEGKVQIYDPVSNTWSLGASMPFAAGSGSSAVIGGQVYIAGGIIGSTTTNQVARYDPATNTWTSLAAMPQGRNHTAAATDGSKFYIFGGRDGPNVVANGFNTVQIYDPATNTWTSTESGSSVAPLPQARGGMGKAVYYNGEFYIMGGETLNGPGATPDHVYNRVDIYDPTTNTWRLGPPMPTARHGIFPLYYAGRIYVAGGGIHSGGSQSTVLEIYTPD